MRKNLILLFITAFLLLNCSSKEVQNNEEEIAEEAYEANIFVDVNKIYCWVDLMPKVNGQNKLHVTGEITVYESEDYDLRNINLKQVKIFQKNKLFYTIRPTIRENDTVAESDLRNFLFSTIRGLSLAPNFNIEKEVDIEFIFNEDSGSYTYKIFNQSIDKVH